MTAPTVWLCCGVLKPEMTELHRRGRISGELLFLDSMLHMHPPRLDAALAAAMEVEDGEPCLVLAYGDCSAGMLDLVRRFRLGRVDAINCAQLLAGKERYRRLMSEEAFMVLPEWAMRWEQVMKGELGLSSAVARDLMGENRGVLVYLDTGLAPVPYRQLEDFSAFVALPYRVEPVGLDHLLAALLQAQRTGLAARSREEKA